MRIISLVTFVIVATPIFWGCEKSEILPENNYACNAEPSIVSDAHPDADSYQSILDENQNGIVGAVLLVKDQNGIWIGSSGKADIASNVDVEPCNTFFIASISKVFTAAAVYSYIDKGLLKLGDPITKWLPGSIISKVDNANEAQIEHLLSHRSGIADYYTDKFELDIENRVNNKWSKEEVLTYTYSESASFSVGESYSYSNSNFLLLSMILESASSLSFEKIYQQEIFQPLNLQSAYYSESRPIPDGAVIGYSEFTYNSGQFHDARDLYIDELGIGGDGGIAINAYELSVFLESLMKGELISDNSLNEMTNWFDLPKYSQWEAYGQTENGYGLERFNTQYGFAVGHTGGINGFDSYGFYFPEEDMTYILLTNGTKGESDAHESIFNSTLKVMFD